MSSQTQRFENHARYYPLFHFVAVPLLVLYLLYSLYALVRTPTLATLANTVLAAGVCASLFAARIMVLVVQNRVIRLEMAMRLERVLGAAAAADAIATVPLGRLISLRFASDPELAALLARVRSRELATNRDVKQAIREWQPDLLRA
ncbi:MAG: hypothetical protein H0U66_13260 [Gemmatimonadaceae bacterium]|nr:hypothetical protein [Gemmatimonadaceae bacterium]